MGYINLYDLRVGDICMEDTYPQKYKVVGFKFDENLNMNVVVMEDMETKEQELFGYMSGFSGPCMILLERSH